LGAYVTSTVFGLGPPDGTFVCLTGETSSSDFPVTPKAAQKANAGAPAGGDYYAVNGDVCAAALDGNTGGLVYASFLGGPNADTVWDLHGSGLAPVQGSPFRADAQWPVSSARLMATRYTPDPPPESAVGLGGGGARD
jgi:hypothetical protein